MKSRVNREVHARFCEGLGVKFPRATRPGVKGREPRFPFLIAGEDQTGLAISGVTNPRSASLNWNRWFGKEDLTTSANKLARIAWAVLSSGQDYRAVPDAMTA
jgi:hypothetical protein